jgi:hypothetical protein
MFIRLALKNKTNCSLISFQQCCGSVTFWYGSGSAPLTNGSRSCYFRPWYTLSIKNNTNCSLISFQQCCGSVTFWYGSRSAPWPMDLDTDPAIFVLDLQDGNKKLFLKVFLLITFKRNIYIIYLRLKVIKMSKTIGIKVFLTIFAWL